VTAGLVRHHFGTKDALIAAVDAQVHELLQATLDRALAAFEGAEPTDAVATFQSAISGALRDQATLREYVARRLTSDSEAGQQIFVAFVALVDAGLRRLRDAGRMRDDVDHTGSVVTVVHLILGPVLLARRWSALAGVDSFDPVVYEPGERNAHQVLGGGMFLTPPPA
jgi:AcrR family transcriptional regulator